jgi:glycosyltransferase involved in cell wall biosynthesis
LEASNMSTSPIGVMLGADSLLGPRSGIGRQAFEVAHRLREDQAVGELALLVGERCLSADEIDALTGADMPGGARSVARTIAAAVPGAAFVHGVWRRRSMNRFAAAMAQRIDGRVVYHEVNLIARPFDGVSVVTVHDLSWRANRQWHRADRCTWIERRLPRTLAQASRFVCVSEFTASDAQRELGVARSRIDIVRPGVSAIFRPMSQDEASPVLGKFGLADRRYLFAVSTLEPRKNFDRLLAAHCLLPASLRQRFPLVIAGGRGWGETLAGAAAERARRDGALHLIGHVTDDDLVALYARCAAVAYVSLYEGFGLPVLEAMACGAPVIASATSAVGETAGDAALRVEPEDTSAIANALERVLTDEMFAAELVTRGRRRAASFTWDAMTQGLVASWRRALGPSDHQPGGEAHQPPE